MLPAQAVPPSNANTASTPTSRAIIAESFLPPSAYSRSTRIAPPFPARQSAFSRSAPARVKAPAGDGPSVTTKLPEQHAAGIGLHRLRMDGQEMIAQKVRLQHLFPVTVRTFYVRHGHEDSDGSARVHPSGFSAGF